MVSFAKRVTCRAVVVLFFTLYAFGSGIASIVLGTKLRIEMGSLMANNEDDPEQKYLDECMRDYENLQTTDSKYRSRYSKCVKEITDDSSLKRLPHIRLTVDERVCDPADLCVGSDPGQCEDVGNPQQGQYRPGDVTNCYLLIDSAKAEQNTYIKATKLDRVAAECTNIDRWKDYSNKVQLTYCFWKHLQAGVCTNRMRTNCPTDSSCCPVAQNDPHGSPTDFRPDQYLCQKSPIVGLYCQQRDYRVPVNASSSLVEGPLCTQVSCSTFAWCRDLADVPGECLGDACKEYRRAVNFLIASIICAGLGVICDIADIVILARCSWATKLKSLGNITSACLKLLAWIFCLAGGVSDFLHDLVDMQCFNNDGNKLANTAKDGVKLYELVAILTTIGSALLAPMSMKWGGKLVGLPYARVS